MIETMPAPTAAASEATLKRLLAANQAARRWLHEHELTSPGEARADLLDAFGADLVGSRLGHSKAVRIELDAALAAARELMTAPAPTLPATSAPPTTLRELASTEQAAAVASETAAVRWPLREAIDRAAPVANIMREAVTRFATVMLEAQRVLFAERHVKEIEWIKQLLARQRHEIEGLRATAVQWNIELAPVGQVPSLR